MDFVKLIKSIENGKSLSLYGKNNDVIVIKHEYDYVYTIKLNNSCTREFLIKEAAVWLDFYESKRGKLEVQLLVN